MKQTIYIHIPDNAKYCKTYVLDDTLAITYAIPEKSVVLLPKPTPLVGGTNVYKKDIGYWYCTIKDRDEFMNLYFEDLTVDDILYDNNGIARKFITQKQKIFKINALKAIERKPAKGYCWIPVYEPSFGKYYEIQFVPGKEVATYQTGDEWEYLCQKYSPENGSQLSSTTTYFLLLLRWLKDGIIYLEEIADDSELIGHFWDSKCASHNLEVTGRREFGGLYGFVGNSHKMVKDSESTSGFSLAGGSFFNKGNYWPLAKVHNQGRGIRCAATTGFLELN